MLVKNRITSLLYEYGYDGRDNIYEYLKENRDDFFTFLNNYKIRKKYSQEDMKAFEYKVRWASHYGMWFRLYIDIFIVKGLDFESFNKVPINFGGSIIYLPDFLDDISKHVDSIEKTDVRGLSLIDYTMKDFVIDNVDFSYSTLDYSRFEGCVFKNCNFYKTSFRRSELVNCHFDEYCSFFNNDFSKALIDSDFICKVQYPIIKKPGFFESIKIKLNAESKPLNYTKIVNDTFKPTYF